MVEAVSLSSALATALWAVRANYPHGVPPIPAKRWALIIPEVECSSFWSSESGQLLQDIIGKGLKTSREQVAVLFAAGSEELSLRLAALDPGSPWSIIVFSKNFEDHALPPDSIIADDLASLAKDREAKKLFWEKLKERL